METIKNYLDNMFSGIVQTDEMIQLKNEIYANMSEKYQDLKAEGKSENEAIGEVISEFGNIDELMEAYQMSRTASQPHPTDLPEVTLAEAEAYIAVKKKIGALIGGGVFLCLLGVIALIATSMIIEFGNLQVELQFEPTILGVVFLLILVAAAVGLFIYGGTLEAPYEYLQSFFYMDESVRAQIEEDKRGFQPVFTVFLVIGVALCVMSPIPILLTQVVKTASDVPVMVGVCILLLMVGAGTFLFICFGNVQDAYSKLLELEDYSKSNKRKNKAMEAISSAVWSIAVIIFLAFGFIYGKWHPAWLIFPLVGIVMGVIESIVKSSTKE